MTHVSHVPHELALFETMISSKSKSRSVSISRGRGGREPLLSSSERERGEHHSIQSHDVGINAAGDGEVELGELLKMEVLTPQRMYQLFVFLDGDTNGKLTALEANAGVMMIVSGLACVFDYSVMMKVVKNTFLSNVFLDRDLFTGHLCRVLCDLFQELPPIGPLHKDLQTLAKHKQGQTTIPWFTRDEPAQTYKNDESSDTRFVSICDAYFFFLVDPLLKWERQVSSSLTLDVCKVIVRLVAFPFYAADVVMVWTGRAWLFFVLLLAIFYYLPIYFVTCYNIHQCIMIPTHDQGYEPYAPAVFMFSLAVVYIRSQYSVQDKPSLVRWQIKVMQLQENVEFYPLEDVPTPPPKRGWLGMVSVPRQNGDFLALNTQADDICKHANTRTENGSNFFRVMYSFLVALGIMLLPGLIRRIRDQPFINDYGFRELALSVTYDVICFPSSFLCYFLLLGGVAEMHNLRSRLKNITALLSPQGAWQKGLPGYLLLRSTDSIRFWLLLRLRMREMVNVKFSSIVLVLALLGDSFISFGFAYTLLFAYEKGEMSDYAPALYWAFAFFTITIPVVRLLQLAFQVNNILYETHLRLLQQAKYALFQRATSLTVYRTGPYKDKQSHRDIVELSSSSLSVSLAGGMGLFGGAGEARYSGDAAVAGGGADEEREEEKEGEREQSPADLRAVEREYKTALLVLDHAIENMRSVEEPVAVMYVVVTRGFFLKALFILSLGFTAFVLGYLVKNIHVFG